MKRILAVLFVVATAVCLCAGCAKSRPMPIAYLAVERPHGVIKTTGHGVVNEGFGRGGFYFGNYNFRPAPDVASYVNQASAGARAGILRNADVRLTVPFAIDILFFGFNWGTDKVTAKGK